MLRHVLPFALLAATGTVAQAQFDFRRASRPTAYTSLSIGLLDVGSIADERSGSDWIFGQGVEWRFTLDYAIQNQSGVGVTVVYATAPLDYIPPSSGNATCPFGCEATAEIWSVMGGFHAGGGQGVHQVLEIDAGATHFGRFRTDDGDQEIDVGDQRWDLSVSIGYGLGIGLSDRLSITLVQDYGLIFHSDRSSGSESRYAQKRTTRLGVRYGMGQKR